MRRVVAALALLSACSGKGVTTVVVDLSVAGGQKPARILVSVYDSFRALKLAQPYKSPSLPGRLILEPADVDQELRIAVDDALPAGLQAGARVQVRPFAQQELPMALGAPVDSDADGVPDAIDNCRDTPNFDQTSTSGMAGDACVKTAGPDLSGGNYDLSGRPCTAVMVTTLAGDGNAGDANGPGATAQFRAPVGLAFDRTGGVLYVSEAAGHRVRAIDASANVSTVAGSGSPGYVDNPTLTAARFNSPAGLLFDANQILVADTGNSVVRIINLPPPPPATGVLTNSGSGTPGYREGAAMQAQYNGLDSMALDSAFNTYVADENNFRIRKLDSQGNSALFAGDGTNGFRDGSGATVEVSSPLGLWFDGGKLYVADGGNHRVRVIDGGGNSSTIAGRATPGDGDGPNTMATFNRPSSLTIDALGDLYVLDSGSGLVRRVSTASGRTDTLAGNGQSAPFADGVGCNATFNAPRTIVAGVGRVLYVADTGNQRIRKITY